MNRLFLALPAALLLTGVAAAQGSDTCSTPQPISGSGPHAYDTIGATTDGQPDVLCDFAGPTAFEPPVKYDGCSYLAEFRSAAALLEQCAEVSSCTAFLCGFHHASGPFVRRF